MTTNDNTPEGAGMSSPSDAKIIAQWEAAFSRASEADERIQNGKSFADWLDISEGFASIRDYAMHVTGSNRPYGKGYTQAYAKEKAKHPWADHYDSGTVTHCVWLHDRLARVIRWRDRLGANERQEWITPRVIRKHYERLTNDIDEDSRKGKAIAAKAKVATRAPPKEELDSREADILQREAAMERHEAELDRLRASEFDIWPSDMSAKEFAAKLNANNASRMDQLIAALQRLKPPVATKPVTAVKSKRHKSVGATAKDDASISDPAEPPENPLVAPGDSTTVA